MIKLGITSCFLYPDLERPYFGPKTLCYLENDMADYLTAKNVLPILIPKLGPEKIAQIMDELDCLVLQGGSDVCPESYNTDYLDKERWPGDKPRDDYELNLVDEALKRNLPILGICRGAQVLNSYFGGTLYQDIPSELDTRVLHRDAKEYDKVAHPVEFKADSELAKIYGKTKGVINSVHHQSIKELGKDLILEAICPDDGIVEGFRYKDLNEKYVLAVQWHPEFSPTLGDKVIDPTPLLNHFLRQVKK